jgi:hypothetical protein
VALRASSLLSCKCWAHLERVLRWSGLLTLAVSRGGFGRGRGGRGEAPPS